MTKRNKAQLIRIWQMQWGEAELLSIHYCKSLSVSLLKFATRCTQAHMRGAI